MCIVFCKNNMETVGCQIDLLYEFIDDIYSGLQEDFIRLLCRF